MFSLQRQEKHVCRPFNFMQTKKSDFFLKNRPNTSFLCSLKILCAFSVLFNYSS